MQIDGAWCKDIIGGEGKWSGQDIILKQMKVGLGCQKLRIHLRHSVAHTTFGDIRIEERHNIHECGKKAFISHPGLREGCHSDQTSIAGRPGAAEPGSLCSFELYIRPRHTTPPCLSSIGWQHEHRHGDGGAAVDGRPRRTRTWEGRTPPPPRDATSRVTTCITANFSNVLFPVGPSTTISASERTKNHHH